MNYIVYWYQILTGVKLVAITDSKASDKLKRIGLLFNLTKREK